MADSAFIQLKEEAWLANMQIPAQGLALYTWGNVSAFDAKRGVLAIKPSGVPYNELKAEDMVLVDLNGQWLEGRLRPSSDTPTHIELYRAFAGQGVGGIIHTHSTYAVAWAQAGMGIPVLGTTHADHSHLPIPCTALLSKEAVERNYEAETGRLIVEHYAKEGLSSQESPMVLVGGHGPFAWASSADKAVYNGAVLEEVAKMAWISLNLNPDCPPLPEHIVQKHWQRKHGATAYYGQA